MYMLSDRTIHEIKNRKVTARRPGGDRAAISRFFLGTSWQYTSLAMYMLSDRTIHEIKNRKVTARPLSK